MQSEKEFKELAQAWIQDEEEKLGDELPDCYDYLEEVLSLMWRSYNQGKEDKIEDATIFWENEKKKREEKMREHDGMKYEIIPIEVIKVSSSEHEEYITGYEYTIFDVYADNEPHYSDEWYETESEAVIAAERMIAQLDSDREG